MPGCYQLTQDELNDYLAQGYVPVGGPYASADDCAANCGASSSGSLTSSASSFSSSSGSVSASAANDTGLACCSGYVVASTLYVTLSPSSGTTGCDCVSGSVITIVWDGVSQWTGSATVCGQTVTASMSCPSATAPSWMIQVGDNADSTGEDSCSPFHLHWDSMNASFCGCCFDVVITS